MPLDINVPSHPYPVSGYPLNMPLRKVQNFVLVWLDASINENDKDFSNSISKLRNAIHSVNIFFDVNSCVNFLANSQNEKIYMIVSGSLGETTVPLVHDMFQLISIYIFCADVSKHERWAHKWPKIKGVFNAILPICNELEKAAQQCDLDSIPISFVSTNSEVSTAKLDQLDQSFMYTKLLKETLFKIDFGKPSIKEFTTYCRDQFANNEKELSIINEFEHKYRQFTPIWWYTRQCFLYPMLNRSLRMMEVNIIIKMGFFIRELHHQIEELHNQQKDDFDQTQSFIVYRGQGLSKKDFNKLTQGKGGLISFNSFLSSSKKRNIALIYANRASKDFDLIGVVFKMTINPSISTTPFALINDISFYKASEQEILFSMHTVFRIGEIDQIEVNNNRLWEVELMLTSEDDQQLRALTQLMRDEIVGEKGWYHLAHLLLKLGKFGKAEELYKLLRSSASKDSEKGYIYHQLGWINDHLGNYVEAITFYEKSLEIDEKALPPYHRDLATSYDNIGVVYDRMGEYTKALSSHEKALNIYRVILPNHSDLATTLNHIGLVYYKMGEYSKALLYHREALDIYKKTLPNHPSLAASYNNIGLVHDKMDDYSKALWFYEKTLEIHKKTLPLDHPDLAICYQNTGKALEKMCEYSKALLYYGKALDIFKQALPLNHPHLATCYCYIASVYNNTNEYSKAIPFYEKALEIREKTLHSNHPDFINLYNNIGDVYSHMKEYGKAFTFYQKGFQLCQLNLASNDLLLASSYHNMANVCYNMGSYSEALLYVERAINIARCRLPSNHSDLRTYNKTLESVKAML